jgi:hypothetical protein
LYGCLPSSSQIVRRSERLRERSVEFFSHDPPYCSTFESVVRRLTKASGRAVLLGVVGGNA